MASSDSQRQHQNTSTDGAHRGIPPTPTAVHYLLSRATLTWGGGGGIQIKQKSHVSKHVCMSIHCIPFHAYLGTYTDL